MVVQVVEWEWIYEIDVAKVVVVVVVEVDGRDNMELGMEDIEDIVDFPHKVLANLASKIGFGVEMAKVAKEGVCYNYFEMDVHRLEILN